MPACSEDDHRAVEVIARRQVDSRQFFGDLGGEWTDLRERLFGSAVDLRPLMAFINPEWTVGDLGCGTGQMTAELAPWVHRVEAIDRETAMLAATRRRLEGIDNVGIHKADVTKLPFDEGALDASILSLILHHLESPGLALAEAGRVTAGPVIVVDMVAHDRTSYRDTMGHLHLGFTREDLTALAEASDLILDRYQPLPPDPDATGPPLFAARLRRAHRVV
jgi:ArsR family transcriptional regulator